MKTNLERPRSSYRPLVITITFESREEELSLLKELSPKGKLAGKLRSELEDFLEEDLEDEREEEN